MSRPVSVFDPYNLEEQSESIQTYTPKFDIKLRPPRLCKICNIRMIGVIYGPCNHAITCQHCFDTNGECLQCKTKILEAAILFNN